MAEAPKTTRILQAIEAAGRPLTVREIMAAIEIEPSRKTLNPVRGIVWHLEARGAIRKVEGSDPLAWERVPGVNLQVRGTRAKKRQDYRNRLREELPGGSPMMLMALRVAQRFRFHPPSEAELIEAFSMSPNTARQWVNAWKHVRGTAPPIDAMPAPAPDSTDPMPRPRPFAPTL